VHLIVPSQRREQDSWRTVREHIRPDVVRLHCP